MPVCWSILYSSACYVCSGVTMPRKHSMPEVGFPFEVEVSFDADEECFVDRRVMMDLDGASLRRRVLDLAMDEAELYEITYGDSYPYRVTVNVRPSLSIAL